MSAPAAASSPPPGSPQRIPVLGLTAVLLGTFISTLNGRLSNFGLADIRGAVHAGFDAGAWITTAQTSAQMLIAPFAVWFGGVHGPRRALLRAALIFAVVQAVAPLATTLPALLLVQFLSGVTSGFFVPLTLSFILRALPPKLWPYGIALYALNLELSLNISASLEGFYVDHLSWRWIYWQNVPLALAMAACLYFGVARTPPAAEPPKADVYGFLTGGIGLALIYAGLDQGNRLDWLNSGLVWGLLLSGGVLFVAFIGHEFRSQHPGAQLRVLAVSPIPQLMLLVAFLRMTILVTAILIPQYLGFVRGFRALEVGQSLLWVAGPPLILCPIAAATMRRSDPRLIASIGFILISLACLQVAHGLTELWGSDQFLPSQLLQAVGQSFALSGVIFYAILHLKPEHALTIGGAIQTARLMGGEIGTAFVVTMSRVRSQIASNHIGLHVQTGDLAVMQRLEAYARVAARSGDSATAQGKAVGILAAQVRSAAVTQGVIDTFVASAGLTALALLLLVSQKAPPPVPATQQPSPPPGVKPP
jgi:DHA2 family multidrug resistance protein